MHQAVQYIHDNAQLLFDEHVPCDEQGRLTDTVADVLRRSGGMRLLQPESHGGYQTHPRDFFEWVRAVGRYNPSAGWVSGVVGIHPWEVALLEPDLKDELYGNDPDTWIASPYAPAGRAVREGDGFRFSGRWQYSTGTDHCGWVVLGGMVVDAEGQPDSPPEVRHFFLPRGDYEIVPDSWNVMGLSGTGSKDIVVENAYVPEYRTILHQALADGVYNDRVTNIPLFQLPFGCIFSGAIAAATFGIAEGAIEQYRKYMETRVSAAGVVGLADPFQQEALSEAEADVAAGIAHVDAMISAWMQQLEQGKPITKGQRLEFRRNQVRAIQRVLFSVDKLMARSGSAAIWTTRSLERRWRDLRAAGSHICNIADTIYGACTCYSFGEEDAIVALY